ncbi:Hypothetical predicted protein [Cloeon dipterum]|uniref:Secreted protein n=1 Tax=Cloeon dipterum TaxID=197152 RepID=A0A8S1CQ34_9INSE|nr:Hypothetical predicted protein [Cloeon dipterum]
MDTLGAMFWLWLWGECFLGGCTSVKEPAEEEDEAECDVCTELISERKTLFDDSISTLISPPFCTSIRAH